MAEFALPPNGDANVFDDAPKADPAELNGFLGSLDGVAAAPKALGAVVLLENDENGEELLAALFPPKEPNAEGAELLLFPGADEA